jgi:hypothetical protein
MRRAAVVVALLIASLGLARPVPVVAHPFGPFSISVYSGLTVHQDHIDIRWVLDMAETAAVATLELIDSNSNGHVTEEEKAEYFDLWVGSILGGITLMVDEQELLPKVIDRELTLPTGEGGVPAVRLVIDLSAELVMGVSPHAARYQDTNYTQYPGWREVSVAAGQGVTLLSSTAPVEGRTKELTVYPPTLGLGVPTSEAEFSFAALGVGLTSPDAQPSVPDGGDAPTGFAVWPTGILAGVVVLAFVGLLVVVNRPREPSPGARRRR